MLGFGICIIFRSWHLGVWRKDNKVLLAIGPLRFVKYNIKGAWKAPT